MGINSSPEARAHRKCCPDLRIFSIRWDPWAHVFGRRFYAGTFIGGGLRIELWGLLIEWMPFLEIGRGR